MSKVSFSVRIGSYFLENVQAYSNEKYKTDAECKEKVISSFLKLPGVKEIKNKRDLDIWVKSVDRK